MWKCSSGWLIFETGYIVTTEHITKYKSSMLAFEETLAVYCGNLKINY
jgi:hypothetical protein